MLFEEVARSALAAVDCDASFVLASQWAVERYQALSSRLRFRHLRVLGSVIVPATYDTGTVTVTRGSTAVTGASTVWTSIHDGRYFRARTNWYRISKATSNTALVLDREFTEDDVAAGSYSIIAKQIALDPEARWISNTFTHPRFRKPLDKLSMAEMD